MIALLTTGCRPVNEKGGISPSEESGYKPPNGTAGNRTADKNGNSGSIPAADPGNTDINSGSDSGSSQYLNREDLILDRLGKMTLDEKIGQMFMFGIEGTVLDDALAEHIKNIMPGGIILFGRNADNPEQLLELINSLKKINSDRIPLFISVDEEGGRVSRMPPQLHKMPSAGSIGQMDDPFAAYKMGQIQAVKIKSFGFNMDLAPVLDIMSNPQNTVIGDRSFGSDPDTVAKCGIQMMKGIRESGVISVVKHFPGHGDTETDSHYDLPSVYHGMDRLDAFELVPFRKAIEENADAVMVAHILLPNIDPDCPASLSQTVIDGLLRDKMGFDGVVITDDMTMAAITKHYAVEDAVIGSISAGSDIIMVCHDYDAQIRSVEAVKNCIESGIIDEKRIDASVFRILSLKDKYGLNNQTIDSIDLDYVNEQIDGLLTK